MLGKGEKAVLYKAIKSQHKQTTPREKTAGKGGLKNAKGKNTTSMVDLHKPNKQDGGKSARNLTASKQLTQSKENQEASHREMLEQELDKFRKEIEDKFRCSEANRNYAFPRSDGAEVERVNVPKEPNCTYMHITG
eukprot:TRINITY_DN934_c0_g1_i5.p1 TRINITY_DN934_c0_g1~~TRINITY_DN934_c0_g1_i5.p1  ORF type:complete len:136 (-),score=41.19 TRINITY_DN934_c0_g1_i5:892-1299(-)